MEKPLGSNHPTDTSNPPTPIFNPAVTAIQGFIAGALATVVMLLAMLALRLWLSIPTPTEMIFDRLFPLTPISVFLGSLGFFGGYTPLKLAGVTGALAGHLIVGGLGGVVYAFAIRKRRLAGQPGSAVGVIALGVLAAWLLTAVALSPNLLTNYRGVPPAQATLITLASLLFTYALAGAGVWFFFRLISRLSVLEARPPVAEPDFNRRRLLAAGVGAVAVIAAGGLLRRLYEVGTFAYDGTQYNGPEVQKITPNEKFYGVSKNLVDPKIDADRWRLEIKGLVENPRQYSLAELRTLPSITQEATLVCISYRVGGGLASNAVWKGVPLKNLIAEARPRGEKVAAILFHASDGYYETFPYDKAMEETTLLAYEMNGTDLPARNGFPVRLVVPGLYGEKNCKWVTQIELVAADDSRLTREGGTGFYKEQGWGPNFAVPTHSFISAPQVRKDGHFATPFLPGQPVTLRGVAIGGDRGISKVEISTDDGASWQPAKITEPGTRISWSIWEHQWTPAEEGAFTVIVRATDGNGVLQIAEVRDTVPQGATGLHRVKAHVESKAA